MDDYFIGEVIQCTFDYIPEGFLPCFGQPVLISKYQALFSVIGYDYGPGSNTTFTLPNLGDSSIIVGAGTDKQTQNQYDIDKKYGYEYARLTNRNIPVLYAGIEVSNEAPTETTFEKGKGLAMTSSFTARVGRGYGKIKNFYTTQDGDFVCQIQYLTANEGVTPTPLEIHQPTVDMLFAICYDGVYPTSNN
jgi:microcystin-dependent protein